jgi:hypothetical protein
MRKSNSKILSTVLVSMNAKRAQSYDYNSTYMSKFISGKGRENV